MLHGLFVVFWLDENLLLRHGSSSLRVCGQAELGAQSSSPDCGRWSAHLPPQHPVSRWSDCLACSGPGEKRPSALAQRSREGVTVDLRRAARAQTKVDGCTPAVVTSIQLAGPTKPATPSSSPGAWLRPRHRLFPAESGAGSPAVCLGRRECVTGALHKGQRAGDHRLFEAHGHGSGPRL